MQETEEADTVKFTAEVKGIPRPVISWALDDQTLQPSETVEMQHIQNLVSVTIHDVEDDFSGGCLR